MKPICPITKEFCFQAAYGTPERCVENTTLEDAATCIRNLTRTNSDMANEIAALDEFQQRLKENNHQH